MKTGELMSVGGNILTWVLSAIQQNEILQIIEFILSAILSIVILLYRVWHWYKEANADGKITKEELEDLDKIISEEEEKKK